MRIIYKSQLVRLWRFAGCPMVVMGQIWSKAFNISSMDIV